MNALLYQQSDLYNDIGFYVLQFQITCKIVPSKEDSPRETLLVFLKKGQKKCKWTMCSQQQQRVMSSQVSSLPAQMKDVLKCTRGILVWKSTYYLVSARWCLRHALCWTRLKRNTTPF